MRIKNILLTTLIIGLLVSGGLGLNALRLISSSSGGGELVGYWTMNQDDLNNDGDTFKDKSGNGNDGAITRTDLVTNGDFDTDTDWTKGTGWTISSGTANCDGTQTGASNLNQNNVVSSPTGKKYRINYTISNYSAGIIRLSIGAYQWLTSVSANGFYSEVLNVTSRIATDTLYIQSNVDFIGSIDDIKVEDITYEQDQNGVPNQAMPFDGAGDYVTVGNIGNIKSFSVWIYPTANTKSIADFDGGTISAEIDASNNITATGWTSPTVYVNGIASDDITLNVWNYITITSGTNVNASALVLGNEVSYFTGSISDVAIYSSALTQDEVSKLYLAGRTTAKIKIDAKNLVVNGDMELNSDWSDYRTPTSQAQSSEQAHSGTYSWKIVSQGGSRGTTQLISGLEAGQILKLSAEYYIGSGNGAYVRIMKGSDGTTVVDNSGELIGSGWNNYSSIFTVPAGETSLYIRLTDVGSAGTYYFDDIKLTKNNTITPKLQKGLILDMPLYSPYTEAFTVYEFGGFVTDSWTARNGGSIDSETTISGTGVHKNLPFKAGKKYNIKIVSSDYTNISSVYSKTAPTNWEEGAITSNFDNFNIELISSPSALGMVIETTGSFTVTNIVIVEFDGTTKDRTPQGNDGTVSGATIKYDGLVDTAGGVAYINQDKAYGTWEFDVNKHDDANVYIHFISDDSSLSNGYRFGLRSTENIQLDVITNGAYDKTLFTANAYISADTDYRIKITRNLANHFTTYIKGGVFGWDDWTEVVESTGANPTTTNDDDYTTSTNFIVQAVTNVGNKISNLKINGKRHSLNKATVSTGTFTTTAGAYDFDTATDERITLPYSSEIAMGSDTQDFTISMWIQRDDLTRAWRTLFDTRDDNNDGWEFLLQSTLNGGLSIRIGTSDIDASNLAIADNEWHHIVGVVDRSDTASLYVDGVEVSYTKQISTSGITLSTSIDPVIGARAYATSEAFDGQISNLKVWNRVLTASDINYLYSKERVKY